ncbi:hypothetical protein BUALT_Bualt01G0139000 [Buddleja alternifolia]|uniref:Poly(A) RNA polymerase mitochondrial-like central palm domain-containing protein n=1 Tax=Buddleja alternifolia TaxID=168488 RepID=A0AAV6YCV6_9LAMI|nr:hypothetical protein BUALT_Bualt01G0139000 [Buddleja alternifolia]
MMVLISCDALISVLQKKAEKFKVKKLQVHKVTKEQASVLEPLLQDVYSNRRPKPIDYEVRRYLVRVYNEIAKEIYGNILSSYGSTLFLLFQCLECKSYLFFLSLTFSDNSNDIPVVVEFGSFVMDLFSTTSDLDLSVNFNTNAVAFSRERKIQTLRKFAKKLYAIQSKVFIIDIRLKGYPLKTMSFQEELDRHVNSRSKSKADINFNYLKKFFCITQFISPAKQLLRAVSYDASEIAVPVAKFEGLLDPVCSCDSV